MRFNNIDLSLTKNAAKLPPNDEGSHQRGAKPISCIRLSNFVDSQLACEKSQVTRIRHIKTEGELSYKHIIVEPNASLNWKGKALDTQVKQKRSPEICPHLRFWYLSQSERVFLQAIFIDWSLERVKICEQEYKILTLFVNKRGFRLSHSV